jgi:hypothetical protein
MRWSSLPQLRWRDQTPSPSVAGIQSITIYATSENVLRFTGGHEMIYVFDKKPSVPEARNLADRTAVVPVCLSNMPSASRPLDQQHREIP